MMSPIASAAAIAMAALRRNPVDHPVEEPCNDAS
jgi:hypothetical protein